MIIFIIFASLSTLWAVNQGPVKGKANYDVQKTVLNKPRLKKKIAPKPVQADKKVDRKAPQFKIIAATKPVIKTRPKPITQAPVNKPKPSVAKAARPDVLEGLDYSWGYYSGLAPKIKLSKKHFVMRYTNTGEGKEITAAEVKELKKAGLGVGIVHQITKKDFRPLEGFKAGQADARTARQTIHDVGLPANMPIYFSVDFDANQAHQQKINEYLKGAGSILGKNRVGVYGGYYTVARALNSGVVKYAWQTYSWSKGQWDPRAQIRQYKNSQKHSGIPVDYDKTNHSDNGIQY